MLDAIAHPARRLSRFAIRAAERTIFVPVQAVDWIEASQNYVCLHAEELAWIDAMDTGNPFNAMLYDVEMSAAYMRGPRVMHRCLGGPALWSLRCRDHAVPQRKRSQQRAYWH